MSVRVCPRCGMPFDWVVYWYDDDLGYLYIYYVHDGGLRRCLQLSLGFEVANAPSVGLHSTPHVAWGDAA